MLNLTDLIGLTADEAKSRLDGEGADYNFSLYKTDKQSLWDTELVLSVREGNPIELVVGRFLFSCEVQNERDA